uniref:Uncharacterized protein n=1 Tax=Anguilla anguilla TaxID=7936 RepID=A0A0E9QGU9_ANGAN
MTNIHSSVNIVAHIIYIYMTMKQFVPNVCLMYIMYRIMIHTKNEGVLLGVQH